MIRQDVGQRIKYLRKIKLRITQDELAKLISKDRVYVARVESGKQNITMDTLADFCNALNITVSDFFAFEIDDENCEGSDIK